ncbi:MAG: cob(I)yrinic acid a,c-diamide adenosyltransferase [bacterium]|nr:cob(I)yrinic acid a,c-diamide adenosyltransferase [bacterium]
MSIYTKKGDKGKTSIFNGKRLSKDSLLIEAIGSMDEANSWLGVIGGFEDIQKDLMTISSILSGAKVDFSLSETEKLEKEIDGLEKKLPKLKGFTIPGGSGAKLHFARTLVRRAERGLVSLEIKNYKLEILAYMNRLSDYLYMKAREENFKRGKKEEIWKY